MARDAIPYITIPLALALAALYFGWWPPSVLLLGLAVFMAYFFRDPQRASPSESDVVVSPADGRVTQVRRLEASNASSPTLVSIFLSPLDVHINRAPIAGEVTEVVYTKGKFLIATNQDASIYNEQNALTIKGERVTVVCKQIAGVLARRIVCWKSKGDVVSLGERFGLIKFSSRTDLIMPPEVEVLIEEGMRVRGGVTIIGRIR